MRIAARTGAGIPVSLRIVRYQVLSTLEPRRSSQGGAFMHHGKFTTAEEAVEAHNGEALSQRLAFDALPAHLQDDLIEFLKSLQVLPPGSRSLWLTNMATQSVGPHQQTLQQMTRRQLQLS